MPLKEVIGKQLSRVKSRFSAYLLCHGDNNDVLFRKKVWYLFNLLALPVVVIASFLIGDHYGPEVIYLNAVFISAMIIPLAVFHFHKDHIDNYAFFTQLAIVVLTSAKVYFMGGMLHAGTPVYVGFIAPVYALTFPNKKRAVFVVMLLTTMMIMATLLNPYTAEDLVFSGHILGFIVGVFMVFVALYYFTTQLEQAKRIEKERVEELDRLKTKFYTHITHEFRTPLSVIMGMSDLIKKDPEKWLSEGHRIIKRNSQNLIDLTNRLLDLSKLEAKAMTLNMIKDDIVLYLRYLTESFHSLAEIKHISMNFSSVEEEIIMDFDIEKIREIFINLLSNAIKYTPEGGSIRIQINRIKVESDDQIQIIIEDTGIGIPEKDLDNIFSRYFQADNHRTSVDEGTGIGLSLTHELVKLLGGGITVESELNKGTAFTITLPLTTDAEEKNIPLEFSTDQRSVTNFRETDRPGFESIIKHENRLKVLVVEDNKDVVRYIKGLLSAHYDLEIAFDGKLGLEKALKSVPDLILSDIMMPYLDGYSLCRELKNDMRTSHIPVVLLTARSDMDSKIKGYACGADAYLSKPFNSEELFIRIKKLIELRKALQNRYSHLNNETSLELEVHRNRKNLEDKFISSLHDKLLENLDNEDFNIDLLCSELGMSRSQLYRKFNALTNTTIHHYFMNLKLQKARQLLLTTDLNVSEVAYDTGFKSPSHFSRAFNRKFGCSPSDLKITQ